MESKELTFTPYKQGNHSQILIAYSGYLNEYQTAMNQKISSKLDAI